MTILIVEDDAEVLTAVDRLLTARGHKVLAAHDPGDAAFVVEEHGGPPDLLLTDLILPGHNGLEYGQSMKAAFPPLKVIFMTGWPHRAPSALRSGLGPVLQKPFTAEQLYRAVEGPT